MGEEEEGTEELGGGGRMAVGGLLKGEAEVLILMCCWGRSYSNV
jgi:hypothetical protein